MPSSSQLPGQQDPCGWDQGSRTPGGGQTSPAAAPLDRPISGAREHQCDPPARLRPAQRLAGPSESVLPSPPCADATPKPTSRLRRRSEISNFQSHSLPSTPYHPPQDHQPPQQAPRPLDKKSPIYTLPTRLSYTEGHPPPTSLPSSSPPLSSVAGTAPPTPLQLISGSP